MLLNLKPSWLLTIVVSLFSLHTHSFSQSDLEPTFHANTKSAFIDNDWEEEIITLLPSHQGLVRTRRNVASFTTSIDSQDIETQLHAFKELFHLNFTLDSSYISPYLIVQKGNSSWINTLYSNKTSDFNEKTCIFTGYVNNNPKFIGSANLCEPDGMTASFVHKDYEYYITPVTDRNEVKGTHSIRRRIKRSDDNEKSKHHECATNTTYMSDISLNYKAVNLSASSQTDAKHSRGRRSISSEHTVELMIVADSKMAEYHGDKLETYVLSLIAVTSRIYKDSSLGNFVNLALVKIRIITNPQEGPNITSDAQESLANFCEWQYDENELDDSSPYHHDTAVLLTRVNICRSEGKCGTLGLAELGTVCNQRRSCAIIEDNGLSSSFTIAHEIGHVFGVPHDDSNACTRQVFNGDTVRRSDYKENQFHLMSSTLDYNSQTWSWSDCSRRFITHSLDQPENIQCLQDKPTLPLKFDGKLADDFLQGEPGEAYSKNVQCELVYGSGAKICPYMPVCRRLWCTLPDNTGCRTQHMPWADGTRCGGPDQWCQRGVCEHKSLRPEPTDGKWSLWDSWSECSRTCGGGVKYSDRTCDNPSPQSGGKFCLGRRRKYRSCNTKPCPTGAPSYREKQCEAYNGQRFNYEEIPANPKYTPYYSEVLSEQCKLYCSVSDLSTTNFYKMNDKVEDGTKCTKDGTDICVGGACLSAGCDNVLGSSQRVDMCGVCGGDNSTCRLSKVSYKAYVTGYMAYGYNRVATLPVNSSSVQITQTSALYDRPDENYLALRDSKGTYLFNGQFIVMMYGLEVKLQNGATVEFSGSEQTIEEIVIRDFISEELTIEVLSVGSLRPANVSYSYVLPIEGKISFQWSVNDSWTRCSSECGGIRSQVTVCLRDQDNLIVSGGNCKDKQKPAVRQQKCNLHCVFRWKTESIEDCSANCGRGFVQRKVTCIKQSSAALDVVPDDKCTVPKPSQIEACQGRCSPTIWKFTDWTNCSNPCGGGVQTRQAKCTLRSGRVIGDFACSKQSKIVRQACNTQECTQYNIDDWGQCSVTCGLGFRTRNVVCLEAGRPTDLNVCGSNPPPTREPCHAGVCPKWVTSEWTDCSATCGLGLRYRAVRCIRGDVNGEELEDEYCAAELQPSEVSNCSIVSTCPRWIPSEWSACSVTCGGEGIQRRAVECRDHEGSLVAVNYCQMDQRLPSTKLCSSATPCSGAVFRGVGIFGLQNKKRYVWKFGLWSSCSVTCGEGVINRQVKCIVSLSNPEVEVSETLCKKEPKPASEKSCTKASCGVWRSGSWSQCSTTCGEGVQSRVVICALSNGEYSSPGDCDLLNMPETKKPCENLETCPTVLPTTTTADSKSASSLDAAYWRAGPWTQCSKSCGGGLRRRAVECYTRYRRGSGCHLEDKPEEQEACNEQTCPTWRKGGWAKCSSDCGYGTQQRMVICQLYDKSSGKPEQCSGEAPSRQQECMIKPCGTPVWATSQWSQCSMSCGAGNMLRNVTCIDSANKSLVLDSSLCSLDTKPLRQKVCILSSCNEWRATDWSECDGTCDGSVRKRSVWCSSLSGKELIESQCADVDKPAEVEPCVKEQCKYQWNTSVWTKCSATCGEGREMRALTCVAGNNTAVNWDLCSSWQTPTLTRPCNAGSCPVWKASAWDECSVTCGEGQRLRLVECVNTTANLSVNSNLCNSKDKPRELSSCQAETCAVWATSDWGQCSGPCNSSKSFQTRQVTCIDPTTSRPTLPNLCSVATKPLSSRPCQNCSYWVAMEWSRCSATCGIGIQARKIQCVGSNNLKQQDDKCSNEPPPKLLQSCQLKVCAVWKEQLWSRCSSTCGEGIKTRIVECVDPNTQKPFSDENCVDILKPLTKSPCYVHQQCPVWTVSPWSACSASCGNAFKRRNVTCTLTNGRIAEAFCNADVRPYSVEKCSVPVCKSGFLWKTEKWSECSSSCGEGRQFRKVLCKSVSAEGWYAGNSGYGCTIEEKPSAIRSCNMGPCYGTFIWEPGPWSKCSVECGWGNQRRKLSCVASNGEVVTKSKCNLAYKPERAQKCYAGACQSKSCSELRQHGVIREDGEYQLLIRGKLVEIFCYKMYSKSPEEYLTLPLGANENYASIYGHRLAHPYECPYDTNKVETPSITCKDCIASIYHRAGETRFTKIRINVTSLMVDVKDFTFSNTEGLNQIPYASAGDCYSALICPQGHFSINLKNTGFKVAKRTKWTVEGSYSNQQINPDDSGEVVKGKCGGYCGICSPSDGGLQLAIANYD